MLISIIAHAMAETKEETKFSRQILAALESAVVISKLGAIIKEAISDAITESLKVINTRIIELSTSVTVLRNEFQARDATMAALEESNKQIRAECH